MAKVTVDTSELEKLGKDLHKASVMVLGRLGERGYKLLAGQAIYGKTSGFVPYKTGNLQAGVAPPEIDDRSLKATITVTGRSAAEGAKSATVHYPSGKTKQVMLRPVIPFDYADVADKGRPAIRPKVGKALLIPVDFAPTGESYISKGSQIFVVRRSAKATKGHQFMKRTQEKLESEAPVVVGKVFAELFT